MTRIRSVLALGLAGTVVVLLALVGTAGARVSDGGSDRFEVVSDGAIEATQITPLGLDPAPAEFVAQVEGNSVAEVQAERGGTLTDAEKQQIAAEVAARQEPVKAALQAAGAEVLGDYQYAINGIKVRAEHTKVQQLEAIPGVVAVRPLFKVTRENTNGVPLVGAPAVWAGTPGYRGEGIKIAIIDTGIDYTHADFGGPGTIAAYNTANAADTAPANPAWFGPAAPKVKGGIDLVGDDYNADGTAAQQIPHPDPNPLDCNGHGTHVAGSAAGFGVLGNGSTYSGPYNASTISSNTWNVGPGVAPKADLYAIRVFGCAGSTDVTVDAIEWAVANDMDVINMSLGSPFGTKDDPSAIASTNAVKAGVIVVTSAGNSGPSQYITGSPGTGTGSIATAASDPTQTFPGATITTPSGPVTAINANGEPFSTQTLTVKKLVDNPATPGENESLGCSVAAFGGPLPAGTIAVVQRGVCARVAKAIYGQQAGATMVLMVNNVNALPPFEGKITSNPDTGEPFTVTIPFLGVSLADNAKFVTGQSVTVTPTALTNPNYKGFASFSSGGPRTGDSWLKPDITGPGVSIMSADSGSGNAGTILSGTSMASPHVAGVAALVKQAHPRWGRTEYWKAAIVNTGNPSEVLNHRISRGGTGLAQAGPATATQAVALGDPRTASINFGFEELSGDYSKTKTMTIRNLGSSAVTFAVSQTNAAGSAHSVSFGAASVTVPAGGSAELAVTLNVPVATAGNTDAFREVAGLVTLTPGAGENAGVTLRVPYYLVPRALSDINTRLTTRRLNGSTPTNVQVTNRGAIAGDADFYAWGLEDAKEGRGTNDLYGVGIQSHPFASATDPNRRLLIFAVSTFGRWSNAATNEFDINVDVDNNGSVDYVVVGADVGAVTAGSFDGVMGSFVFSTRSAGASRTFNAFAPHDGTTLLLPFLTSQLCRTNEPCLSMTTNPRITYSAVGFDLANGGADAMPGTAKFNVWNPSISQGMFVSNLAPGASTDVPVSINPTEWAQTPAKGIMVVSHDDKAGREEADLQELTLR